MKHFETERLVIRNFEIGDVTGALKLFSDDEGMRLVDMYPALKTEKAVSERLGRWSKHDERLALIRKDNGECIGYIAINPYSEEEREDTRELGFAISGENRRKGFMVEAINKILEELRAEGIKYVWACCFKENTSSEKLIRKLGFEFQQEGSCEASDDVVYESLEFRMTL